MMVKMTPVQNAVSYLRVSTKRQGDSGLGLEAQRTTVTSYLNGGNWRLVEEFVEVESGKNNERPQLKKALSYCRIHHAKLIVARLDRLARNTHFLTGLREAGIDFVCCDMPFANQLTVDILAAVAQAEGEMISKRTKAALQAAKIRGVKLGSPKPITRSAQLHGALSSLLVRRQAARRWVEDVRPIVESAYKEKKTLRAVTHDLNDRQIPARKGGQWHPAQVMMVLKGGKT